MDVLSPDALSQDSVSQDSLLDALSQDSLLECQICFNDYSPRRRPKLLSCRHTCCSVCLTQMRSSQKELRCPWCRGLTRLPPGVSVAQLPDDPDVVAAVTPPHASERTPVYIRLPSSSGCYMLPLPVAPERARAPPGDLGCRFLPGGVGQLKGGVAVVAVPEVEGVGAEGGERRAGGGGGKGSTWSGVCTVLLVACVLLFLLGIVLHNMSCISKRFTVISCG